MSFAKVTAIGRVVRQPELRYVPSGKAVCDVSLACDDGYGDNKTTVWLKVTAWEKQAELCANYLEKGRQVYVEARFNHQDGNPRAYTKKNGEVAAQYELTLQNITFLGNKSDNVDPQDPYQDTLDNIAADPESDENLIPF